MEVVRVLGPEDLEVLEKGPGQAAPSVMEIRASHHKLAQVLASGVKQEEASALTGYSPSRISILKGDPAFAELLAHYTANRELVFVDAMERLKTLGISTLEVLQDRIEKEPEKWSNKELLDLASVAFGKTPMVGAPPTAPASVVVNFIRSENSGSKPQRTIDHEP